MSVLKPRSWSNSRLMRTRLRSDVFPLIAGLCITALHGLAQAIASVRMAIDQPEQNSFAMGVDCFRPESPLQIRGEQVIALSTPSPSVSACRAAPPA
jgi:hypothetical protein